MLSGISGDEILKIPHYLEKRFEQGGILRVLDFGKKLLRAKKVREREKTSEESTGATSSEKGEQTTVGVQKKSSIGLASCRRGLPCAK